VEHFSFLNTSPQRYYQKDNKRILSTVHRFENLDKTNQFLERHKLPKLTQQEIGNVNKPVSVEEIESIINNLPKQKAPDPDEFTGELY